MGTRINKRRFRRGLSLVDIMTAIVTLSVAVIGTANYRYYTALGAREAAVQTTAARIGLLLCENWRGVEGDETYDPTTYFGSDLPITVSSGPEKPEDFTLLGSYTVELNGGTYYVTLSWKDVHTGLRALNIVVAWTQRNQVGTNISNTDKLFALTTYTPN